MTIARTGGLTIVEFAQGTSGPVCGRLFAAVGETVVKVEPGEGDYLRRELPLGADGLGLSFVALNADKISVVLDLDADEADLPARDVALTKLLDSADVVITDPQSRAAAAGALDSNRLQQNYPAIVVIAIEGVSDVAGGLDPLADPLLAEAFGGLAAMIGDPDRKPLALGANQSAYAAGCAGFFGAMVALRQRDASGVGDVVTASLPDLSAFMDWKSEIANAIDPEPPTRRGSDRGDWRVIRSSDGWVGIIYQPWQWDLMLRLIPDPRLASDDFVDQDARRTNAGELWDIIGGWAEKLTKVDIYTRAQDLGLPFGFVADAADLGASPQLRARGFVGQNAPADSPAVGSPLHAEGLPWFSGSAPTLGGGSVPTGAAASVVAAKGHRGASSAPLSGIIVLDFGTITAGAATARFLADYGATVISVESTDNPDPFRAWKSLGGNSPYFASNNVAKSGIVINLKTPEGRQLVHQLARIAHVFVENYRVGVTERLGIDWSTLHEINPDLIYLSMSSQGQQGPESRNSSYGSTIDLLSGLASITGYEPGHPMWSSSDVNYPDQLVSLLGAGMVVYCLERGLAGVHFDMSQREVITWTLGAEIAAYEQRGEIAEPDGNRRPGRSPHDTYPTADGEWLAIAGESDAQRDGLGRLLGIASPGDLSQWIAAADDVDAAIVSWLSTRDRDVAIRELLGSGVAAVPVLSAAERSTTKRFSDHGVRIDGAVPLKGYPLRFARIRPSAPVEAPALGRDTVRILREYAGLDQQQIESLEANGIVATNSEMERQPS